MDNVIAGESADGGGVRVGEEEEEEEAVNEAMTGVDVEESADGRRMVQLGKEVPPNEMTGDAIVKEITDGEHKMQVGDEETFNGITGNAIVEEIADGECKVQVGDEETFNETTGNAIVEESADGECKVQVGDEETFNETIGNAIVEGSACGECKVQVGDGETFNETTGNAIVGGECKVQVSGEETFNETIGNDIVEESADGERKVQVGDEETFNETTGNAIIEESADGECKVQVGDEETFNETIGNAIVEGSACGECKVQVGDGETFNETTVNAIVGGERKVQVGDEETFNETTGCAIVEESADGERKMLVGDEETFNETTGCAIVEESADGECNVQVEDEETFNETTGCAIVEESVDGEREVQVGDEETFNETTGCAIVEESADGECKVLVGDEETFNETTGCAIVEESADGECKVQVGDEETFNETISSAIVEENADGEHKVQVGDGETFNESTVNAIVEESTDGYCKVQIMNEEMLNETISNAIVEESTDGECRVQVGDGETFNESTFNAIVKESTDGHCKVQVRDEEMLNETISSAIVEESTDGECRVQVGDGETFNESTVNAIVKESTDGHCKVQVRDEEMLNETITSAISEEITDGGRNEQASEEEVLNETAGNVIVDENIDAEPMSQVREEEALNEAMGDIIVGESTDGEHEVQVGVEDVLMETLGNGIVEECTGGENLSRVRQGGVLIETVDNVIVAESNGSEHKALVREEDALNGAVGNDIVEESNDVEHRGHEESTDVEHKAQVREPKALPETMGNDLIEETSDVEWKSQVGEAGALAETVGDIIMEESSDVKHMTRVLEAEGLTEIIGDVIMEESTSGEQKAQAGVNDIIKESTAGEHKAQLREEVLNKTVKQAVQSVASGIRVIPIMENDQHLTYHLPSLDKGNFSISDLVWGKVKSHPWWPGQIFDPADASKLAMKYQKKDSFLISYYGDKTFAWCDESQLKPFHSFFSQLEKQCNSDTFIKAIHDILIEVSRRVELGMACSCLPEEDYTKIKYQKVENAGIRGGNINSNINRSSVANYFEPEKLLEYIKTLAQFPNGRVDKLEFAIARSQLKAFYHSKGYPELPIFTVCGGLMESVPENSPSSGKESTEDFVEQCTPVISDLISSKITSKSEESSFNKRESDVEDDLKEKSTSKLTEDAKAVHLANGGKGKSVAKAAEKPISSYSGKKHIIVESDPADSGRCKKRILDSFEDIEFKSPSPPVTSSFKIGEFIRRAASQLTGGPPILKCQAETLQKVGPQADHKIDDVADFDVPPDSPMENLSTNLSFVEEYNSPDELLSQLCLAASDPMGEYSFVSTIFDFFTGFRNFCVSSSSEDTEHVEKRKRGRPRKVISQQAASDIVTSEDEKHVENCERGMNMISQLASSDTSSENEKPVEKRKRGRPRKNSLPASSDSDDMRPLQKPKRGRPRGRPKKVGSQLASPDYSLFESKKLVETRKRGRPRTVSSDIVPHDLTAPDHMKDSYLSDIDLQKKRNGISFMQYQKKRRKSTGEQSLCQLTPTLEQQLQLALNPDMKLTFVAERSIISVEEKIVDECVSTALILKFNNAESLPSETHLIRIFSRYGPLKEAETEVLRKTNCAKVVFKRRVDAEAAFSRAGKYSIFGSELLSYQLKPWCPKSTLLAMPLGTQEIAPNEMAEDTHDAAHFCSPSNTCDTATITMPQDNLVAAFIPTPKAKHDFAPVITAQDCHDLAPIPIVQDNHDTAYEKCNNDGISVGGNLVLSEHAECLTASDSRQVEAEDRESSGKHDPELISTSHENQDSEVVVSLLSGHNLTPTCAKDSLDVSMITMAQDNPDAADIITLQYKCDAEPTVGTSTKLSEQAEDVIALNNEAEGKESSPHDKHGPWLIAAPEEKQDAEPIEEKRDLTSTSIKGKLDAAANIIVEDSRDAAAVITLQDKCDAGCTIGCNLELSAHGKHCPGLISAPEEKLDAGAIEEKHDLTPTSTKGKKLDAAANTVVKDSRDAVVIITQQDKCDAGCTIGSNLDLSEDVIASDAIHMEVEHEVSSPHDKHEPSLIATLRESQYVIPNASPQDEDDSTPITMQDNLDGASITMVEDNLGARVLTPQDKYDEEPMVGSNMEFSEQEDALAASDATQVEAEGKISLYSQDPALMPAPEQNQIAEHRTSLLDQQDSTPTSAHDNLDAVQISLPQDNCDVTSFDASEGNRDAEPIASLPPDNRDAAAIAKPQENHDLLSIATTPDHPDTTSMTTPQDNHDAGSFSSPEDEHDLAPITTEQDCHDLAPITTVQDNQDAAPIIALHGKCDMEPTVGSNLELSEHVEDVVSSNMVQVEVEGKELLPQDKYNPALITTTQQNQDAEPSDSTPPITQVDLDAASICMPQDNQDAGPTALLPQDYHGAAPITTPQDNHEAVSTATPPDHCDIITPIPDKHGSGKIIPNQDSHDLAPMNTVEVNHDAANFIAPQDKCDEGHCPAIGSNVELSEGAVASDTIKAEAEGRESPLQDIHDPALIATPQQNQNREPVASLLDRHDSMPTTTQDKGDAASTTIVPDSHDFAPVTLPQDKYSEALTEGCNIQVSEQAESGIAAETKAEGEVCNVEVSETGTASDAMQI